MPPEVMRILWPALQVGGFTGLSGFLIGSFVGIARSDHAGVFAIASSLQWFTMGTTFWATRSTVLHSWGEDQVRPKDKILASGIAGCVSGSFGGLLTGKANIIPGAIMFAIFGVGGQKIYNMADSRHLKKAEGPEIEKSKGWMNSKWNPVKVLTDGEYEKMLQDKLLYVNAEIAMIDENINALRRQETEKKVEKEENDKSGS